jgi:hypothetical protein
MFSLIFQSGVSHFIDRFRCSAFSGVRNAFSIATRKDTGHRYLRGGRVWRQRTRTSQWERVDHGFAFKICSISQRC